MTVLTTAVFMTLTGTTTISGVTVPNSKDYISEHGVCLEENDQLKIIDEIVVDTVASSPLIMTDNGIIDNAVDRINSEVFESSLEENEMKNIKEQAMQLVPKLRRYDVTLGDISQPLKEIRIGENANDDEILLRISNFIVGQYYPELRNMSPQSKYPNLPSFSSTGKVIPSSFNIFKNVMESRPILLSEIQDDINARFLNDKILLRKKKNFGQDEYSQFISAYDFSELDQMLKKMNSALKMLANSSAVSTVLGFVCLVTPGFQTVGVSLIAVAYAIWDVLCLIEEIMEILPLTDYEIAVIFNSSIMIQKYEFTRNIENLSRTAASQYYLVNTQTMTAETQKLFYPDGSFANNHLDAYRHTYWNAIMSYEFGEEVAKAFSDAREYGRIMDGTTDTLSEFQSTSMDLLNNHAGRKIMTWWNHVHNSLISNQSNGEYILSLDRNIYPEVPTNIHAAIGYYTMHCVSYGFSTGINIYTFSEDQKLSNGTVFRNNPTFDGRILSGLRNTNFGEEQHYLNTHSQFVKRPYFYYPPAC